jgi:hypothetical protein
MGVVVIVRAPGKVVRHLELRALHVTRRGRRRALELVVANRGNISESVRRARVVVSRARTGRRLVTLVSGSRELRPRTSGMLEFGIRRKAHGRMIVRAVVPAAPGRAQLRRTYRIRL